MSKTKSTAKKTTKVKKEISFKSVARNVILIIDGEKYAKAFKERADRDNIKALVEAYNKRNSLKKEKEIIELMLKETTKKTKTPVKKTVKKPVNKKAKVDKIAEAKKLLEADGYTVSKQIKSNPTPRRRRGEY